VRASFSFALHPKNRSKTELTMKDLSRNIPESDESPDFDKILLYDDETHAAVTFKGFAAIAFLPAVHPEEAEFLVDVLNRERQAPGSVKGYLDCCDAAEYGLEEAA
jgi:hypothetical protein